MDWMRVGELVSVVRRLESLTCWERAALLRLGWVSTGTGGGMGEGVAVGVIVAEDGVDEVGGAMMRLSVLPDDHSWKAVLDARTLLLPFLGVLLKTNSS